MVFQLLDNVIDFFTFNFSWSKILHTYWFLFFLEFPRYYLLEIIMVINCKLRYRIRKKAKDKARLRLYGENPLVSILIPGKNEGQHVFALLQSLKEQTYTHFEVIVVDDGSDDNTKLICRNLQKNAYIDRFLSLNERGGKASAANYGAFYAKGKYIIHLDADSSLDRDAVEKILIPFYYDNRIKAVGGCIKVRNVKDNICTSIQALEYLKTIQVGRMVTGSLGICHIISGAFGAFEKQAIEQVGYWDVGPGLDGDITEKLRKAGHKIYFAEDAICLTNVPQKWYKLYRQRIRWSRSLVRFRLRRHRDILEPTRNFSFSNFFSNLDNIFFDGICSYLWLGYIISLLFTHTERLLEVFFTGWMIRFFFSIISFMVILFVSERSSEECSLIKNLPFQTFYTGYFLRATRLIAYTSEIFFHSSYKDTWNPKKTSVTARIEDM